MDGRGERGIPERTPPRVFLPISRSDRIAIRSSSTELRQLRAAKQSWAQADLSPPHMACFFFFLYKTNNINITNGGHPFLGLGTCSSCFVWVLGKFAYSSV